MAHFAELNSENIVINVISCGDEFEESGEQINQEVTGNVWKKTSYNTKANQHSGGGTPFRYNFAGIGYSFDPSIGEDGAFIPLKPFESWILDIDTCTWKAPTPMPSDGSFFWDEESLSWKPLD